LAYHQCNQLLEILRSTTKRPKEGRNNHRRESQCHNLVPLNILFFKHFDTECKTFTIAMVYMESFPLKSGIETYVQVKEELDVPSDEDDVNVVDVIGGLRHELKSLMRGDQMVI